MSRKEFPVPVVTAGPDARQDGDESLSYIEMPKEMNTFSMPRLPEPELPVAGKPFLLGLGHAFIKKNAPVEQINQIFQLLQRADHHVKAFAEGDNSQQELGIQLPHFGFSRDDQQRFRGHGSDDGYFFCAAARRRSVRRFLNAACPAPHAA